MAEAVTVDEYVPGAMPAEFIPNDNDPISRVNDPGISDGKISQSLFDDLVRLMIMEVPKLEESIVDCSDVLPSCSTEKFRLLGVNDKLFSGSS